MNINDKINNLTILEITPNKNGKVVKYKCVCGNVKTTSLYSVKSGRTKSCGCIRKARKKKYKHSRSHALYKVWKHMREYCNPKSKRFLNTTFCKEWESYDNFYEWAVKSWKQELLFTRKDINKSYSPQNCHFVKNRQEIIQKNTYVFDGKTSAVLAREKGLCGSAMNYRIRKFGFDTALSMEKKESGIENIISQILDKNNISYKREFGVERFIADFMVKDLIIECDGLYWHSDAVQKDKNYHKNKKEVYNQNGYKSIFLRENEILYKTEICESIIKNKLGLSDRIFARKCSIEKISKERANIFFLANHLMGKGKGECVGLIYNGELVSAIRTVKGEYLEIDRFCSKLGVAVVGGFSKLLSVIPENIKTIVDKRYGDGCYLSSLGFTKRSEHLSFRWTKGLAVYHRMKFPGNTGYEHGYNKIWDCGQAVFTTSR